MIIDGYCTLGQDREYDLAEPALLQAMDVAGVDRAVIAPPDRNLAVYNRQGNDSMRRAAAAHPDRFIPSCSVNPWYGDTAVEELKRCLEWGARMLVLLRQTDEFARNGQLFALPVRDDEAQVRDWFLCQIDEQCRGTAPRPFAM